MITAKQLTGRDSSHLLGCVEPILRGHHLLPSTLQAFTALRQAAQSAGLDLRIASSFRSFERQRLIWDEKFTGTRPVTDAQGQPIALDSLSDSEKLSAILRWSALPGSSRHHWGSDLDIYDGRIHDQGYCLQLLPAEYLSADGPCHKLYLWLQQHAAQFGFYWPFEQDQGGVGIEPWHLSHRVSSEQIRPLLTSELLTECLQQHPIAGQSLVLEQLPQILQRYCP